MLHQVQNNPAGSDDRRRSLQILPKLFGQFYLNFSAAEKKVKSELMVAEVAEKAGSLEAAGGQGEDLNSLGHLLGLPADRSLNRTITSEIMETLGWFIKIVIETIIRMIIRF
jgi:hypothetical protein